MDVPKFLDLALELETEISKLYELTAQHSGDKPVAAQLLAIANQEINHANIIRRGMGYYGETPGLFAGIKADPLEVVAGLTDARALHSALERGDITIRNALDKLLDLETRFEKVHIGASIVFTDSSLKTLFSNLATGDRTHIQVLKALIESYGGDV